ncbi:hypothetical protein GW793_02085 [bacterium]|uniref:Phospholipid/glycerol acyltransferase domain-containing protein n=1 Tax=candidate division WWE3 bacterium CG22_combo_CG10-13_8_21_14_all_39_12 TaxID=1975094 RepID=A0A2H0BEK6_UNCKA|nr:hypothetical protein [bacterium]PIP56105.1 MAG: hypothetical protein COX05_04875 [candidate division WWE3 bacterium CG22_combo_CG10-13_8_21_14_all_39_12]
MLQKKQHHITNLFESFYLEAYKLSVSNPEKIKILYQNTLASLSILMPLSTTYSPDFDQTKIPPKFITIANHFKSICIANIDNESVLNALSIDKSTLPHHGIDPSPIRHYSVIHSLKKFDINHHIISGKMHESLDNIFKPLGSIMISGSNSKGNYETLKMESEHIASGKSSITMFPEGANTERNPLQNEHLVLPFKTGFAVLAIDLSLPILPISVAFDPQTDTFKTYVHSFYYPKDLQGLEPQVIAQQMRELVIDGIKKVHSSAILTLPHFQEN